VKLKLELDVDSPDFLYGGLTEILSCIGSTIEDSEESAHPETIIRDKRGNAIGKWRVE
jgi:hypothetical protein